MMFAGMFDLCPPLPDMEEDELRDMMEEMANFRGTTAGKFTADVLGHAGFGSEGDGNDGGFLLTIEAYDTNLERAACIALMRIGQGMPESGESLTIVNESQVEPEDHPGDLIGYLLIAGLDGPGEIHAIAAGLGETGTLEVETAGEDRISGTLHFRGTARDPNAPADGQPFEMEGTFSAERVFDQVPTTR